MAARDEHYDVLASTDLPALLAPRVHRRPHEWKCIVLAAQNAMQGAKLCAIRDSTNSNVLTEKSRNEVRDWLEKTGRKPPIERLVEFETVLEL